MDTYQNQPTDTSAAAEPAEAIAKSEPTEATEAAEPTDETPSADATPGETGTIEDKIVEAIKTCYDPEIPVNIYELGLIYDIDVKPEGVVAINMTLTSPACPAAGTLPPEVETKVGALDEVTSVKVEVVWEPVWTPEKMTEAAKLQLGMF